MFVRTVIPGKFEQQHLEYFGRATEEWREYSNKTVVSWLALSEEHPTMPRVFVDPTGLHFTIHKSKGSLAMTRTEVYENE